MDLSLIDRALDSGEGFPVICFVNVLSGLLVFACFMMFYHSKLLL